MKQIKTDKGMVQVGFQLLLGASSSEEADLHFTEAEKGSQPKKNSSHFSRGQKLDLNKYNRFSRRINKLKEDMRKAIVNHQVIILESFRINGIQSALSFRQ
jgi:hypothetical protein